MARTSKPSFVAQACGHKLKNGPLQAGVTYVAVLLVMIILVLYAACCIQLYALVYRAGVYSVH